MGAGFALSAGGGHFAYRWVGAASFVCTAGQTHSPAGSCGNGAFVDWFWRLVASVPLALSGHYGSYLDSLMEAVSGLTTTGVTLVIDLEHLSTADNMWRFVMHLIGGLGLIVVALSLGLLGKATSGLYSSEGRSEHVLPNIVNTVRLISRISLTAIAVAAVILFVMCVLSGMEPVLRFLPFLMDINFWLHYRWLCSYQPVHRVLPFVCAGNRLYGAYAFGRH